ncbi:MAG: DNA adenine methylase, partial [Campylobacterota bacterium]|nr:DNA adenine methylase [Campylobacterota bacterium]
MNSIKFTAPMSQAEAASKIIENVKQLDCITMGVASNKLGMTKHNIKSHIAKYNIETSKNEDGHTTVNILKLEKALIADGQIDKVNITTKANEFISNPMNYEGGKGKLLNKIISMFPSRINRFIEPFGGALTVGVNVVSNQKLYNDNSLDMYNLLKQFKDIEAKDFFDDVSEVMKEYDLYQGDANNYKNLKDYYNESDDKPLAMFYTLILFSQRNRIRLDSNDENITTSFGHDRGFNESLLNKFVKYGKELYKNDTY